MTSNRLWYLSPVDKSDAGWNHTHLSYLEPHSIARHLTHAVYLGVTWTSLPYQCLISTGILYMSNVHDRFTKPEDHKAGVDPDPNMVLL